MAPRTNLSTTLLQTLQTHTGPINAITFSNLGGTYILSGSSDRTIHLSRTEPPSNTTTTTTTKTKPIQKYTSHGYAVLSISVSSQNTHFASSGGDRSVFYWDIQTPDTTVRRFGSNTSQAHSARITSVSFAGGGGDSSSGSGAGDSVLISGSDDKTVRLWDVKSRDSRPIQIWEEAKDAISAVVVAGNTGGGGVEVVTGSVDGRVRSYDLRMGKLTTDVQPGAVTSLDLTVDAKCLLVGCLDGRIRLMDRVNGACLKVFPASLEDERQNGGYKNEGLRLQSCLAANDELVLTGGEGDGRVRAWDVLSGKLVGNHEVSESGKVVSVVRWREGSKAQDRRAVWAAGGADGIVRVYG